MSKLGRRAAFLPADFLLASRFLFLVVRLAG